VDTVSSTGYVGVAMLMFLENLFPPIPSEMIMPLAGFVAARGELDIVLVVLAGVLGSLLGALPWYYAGRWLGEARLARLAARHGRWLGLQAEDVGKALRWFERHGNKAVLFGRLVPGVRTLISAPAGVAGTPFPVFLLYSGIGTLVWTAGLAAAGYLLEAQYTHVADYMDAASMTVIAALVVMYLWRILVTGRFGDAVRRWAEDLRHDLHAVYLAARDPRVPWYAKGVAFLVAAYAASPLDLVPDAIPVLGQLDDAVLIPLAVLVVRLLVPSAIMREHRRRAEGWGTGPHDWRGGFIVIGLWIVAAVFLVGEAVDELF
jgi:membrane protein DedA with SNARE-associated domain/uncharacterized membrane protein YkvA (DUF1232 family)